MLFVWRFGVTRRYGNANAGIRVLVKTNVAATGLISSGSTQLVSCGSKHV
jgi:hypothetical protein